MSVGVFRAKSAQFGGQVALRLRPPQVTRMDECPQGGCHAPVPRQGGGGRICIKCGASC